MKKAYVTPTMEKIEFQYNKVVAASGSCTISYTKDCYNSAENGCSNQIPTGKNNV